MGIPPAKLTEPAGPSAAWAAPTIGPGVPPVRMERFGVIAAGERYAGEQDGGVPIPKTGRPASYER